MIFRGYGWITTSNKGYVFCNKYWIMLFCDGQASRNLKTS